MRCIALLLIASLANTFATDVQGGIIEVNWTGSVTYSLAAGIAVGDDIVGGFTYDDTAPVSEFFSYYAAYDTNHDSWFSVNGLSGSTTGNSIAVFNNTGFNNSRDQFDSRGTGGTYTGDLLDGISVTQIFVVFTDPTGTALSDTSLPSTLDPSDFSNSVFTSRLDYDNGFTDTSTLISFRVADFSFSEVGSPVPEPTSLAIFGLGAIGLLGIRQRKQKQQPA